MLGELSVLRSDTPIDVTEVVVGITPHCPYGFPGCWAGAKEVLENLDDMLIVASTPDRFNCTARVSLKCAGLPDPVKWPKQLNRRQNHANRPNAEFFGFADS